MLNVLVRVDGGKLIGTGHVYRCLNIVNYINNSNVEFICKLYDKNVIEKISKQYKCHVIFPQENHKMTTDVSTWLGDTQDSDAHKTIQIMKKKKYDIIILDHYGIDIEWELIISKYVKKIIVLDDYVQKRHNCDILINQLVENNEVYKNLVNVNCKLLLGKDYVILGKEYIKNITYNPSGFLKRINIFMGGSDSTNETKKIMKLCHKINCKLGYPFIFDVVLGVSNIYKDEIKILCSKWQNFNYHFNIPNMKELFSISDLSIGSAGISVFERCIINLPSILICTYEKQFKVLKLFNKLEIYDYIGTIDDDYLPLLESRLLYYYKNSDKLKEISNNCRNTFKINHLKKFKDTLNQLLKL